jgi:hypothetical protein
MAGGEEYIVLASDGFCDVISNRVRWCANTQLEQQLSVEPLP